MQPPPSSRFRCTTFTLPVSSSCARISPWHFEHGALPLKNACESTNRDTVLGIFHSIITASAKIKNPYLLPFIESRLLFGIIPSDTCESNLKDQHIALFRGV